MDFISVNGIIIFTFLLALGGVGVYHSRQIKTGEDFALAGRRLGPSVLIGTLVATWIGTGSIFGNAEFTFMHGVAGFFLPFAGALGMVVLSYLAPKARAIQADSVPEILKIRFGRGAQMIGALALIGAYLIIVSYQFRAGATVASRLLPGLSADFLPIGFAIFIILYTVIGGMVSVAWTDFVNGILMATGLIAALVWTWFTWDPQVQPIPAEMKVASGGQPPIAWVGFLLPSFLLILGDANLYQRFMSSESPKTARRSAWGMFVGVVVLECAVIGLAFFGRLMLDTPPDNPAHVIIVMADELLPAAIGILILATATAVIITTADSYLLGASTSVAVDFAKGLKSPHIQRVIVVVLGLAALGLAYLSDEYFSVALYAYTLYGASLTPAVICALLFPRIPGKAVVAGMAAGLGTAIGWRVWEHFGLPEVLSVWDPVLPALAANVGALALFALILPASKTDSSVSTS